MIHRDEPDSLPGPNSENSSPVASEGSALFAFVDLRDPFADGEVAGEQVPGPLLSILSAKRFDGLFLFHTPHTRQNARQAVDEIERTGKLSEIW